MKTKLFCATLVAAGFMAPTLMVRADLPAIDIHISSDIRLGHRPPPPPAPVVVVNESAEPKGPSPWEHGHWYQRSRAYYYYPADDVYFRPADSMWFYQDRGEWRESRTLPESVRIDFNRAVNLSMATDRPYEFHQQIVTRYPRDYFGTRVRLRDEERHEERAIERRGPDRPVPEEREHDRDRDRDRDHDDRR